MTDKVEIDIGAPVLYSSLSLDLDITYVFVLALFLIPLAVLNLLVFKPFLRLFEKRHEQMQGTIERAERRLREAEAKAAAFEEKIQVATQRGIDARNAIRAEAQKEMAARVEAERKKLAERLEAALRQIQAEREQAMAQVLSESKRMAELTAAKLLGRSL